jgi:phosphatidylethanolamine-binding protein (PEBP) family uncharacterized protein
MRDAAPDGMRTIILSLFVASGLGAIALAEPLALEVTSKAFSANTSIPMKYTCDGGNQMPELSWSRVPPATQSIAVLVDDPDAPKGVFTHLLATGIPPTATGLPNSVQGYTAPCPPSGTHHYHFHVYALDSVTHTHSRDTVLKEIQGHVLAQGELVVTYERSRK